MKRDSRFGAHIGTSSLLLIFLTLSLVSFGALSLAGATADKRLSDKLEVHTAEYYAASHEAEAFLAHTQTALVNAWKSSTSYADYTAHIADLPTAIQIPVNDTQALVVEVAFPEPVSTDSEAPATLYTITKWRIETTDTSSYQRHLPVSENGGLNTD